MRLLARQRIKQTGAFAKIPMFQSLGKEQIETLINAMNFKIYPEASSLCVQGDVADCLFILISGQCKVTTSCWIEVFVVLVYNQQVLS